MRRLGLGLSLVVALLGCTGSSPEILAVSLRPVYWFDVETSLTHRRLRLFVRVEDADGEDDLAYLHLIHDRTELYWTLPRGRWIQAELRDEPWIGSYALDVPRGREIPVGSYRVLMQDVAGETDERRTTLQVPPLAGLVFPRPVEGGLSAEPTDEVWAFAADGTLLAHRPVGAVDGAFWNGVARYYLYRFEPNPTVDLVTGPYRR